MGEAEEILKTLWIDLILLEGDRRQFFYCLLSLSVMLLIPRNKIVIAYGRYELVIFITKTFYNFSSAFFYLSNPYKIATRP
tara:strand:+ start:118 stop:360 length:243 start_codon:yes stop_codon:yes gene_type:complete